MERHLTIYQEGFMAEKQNVVTPERFDSGLTYRDYLSQVKVNKDRFEEYYNACQLVGQDVEFFRRVAQMPDGVARILVLGEEWCPDFFRGMPVIERIAEASGIEMRIFARDRNMDIMNEFLKDGQFASIPTVVFYTGEQQYICHWIERPAIANTERIQIEDEVRKENPAASQQEIRMQVGERTRSRYPAWQQETVREIRQIISEKLGLK
jgi:hypothetical protein